MTIKIDGNGNIIGNPGYQIGFSSTNTNNFSLVVPNSPDGTISLNRGGIGSTASTVFSVNSGNVLSLSQPLPFSSGGTNDAGTAWTLVTGIGVSAASGTISNATAQCRYKILGKTAFFALQVSIITNGTGAGAVITTLPFIINGTQIATGRENAVSGNVIQGVMSGSISSNNITIFRFDNLYPGANGAVLLINGVVEIL